MPCTRGLLTPIYSLYFILVFFLLWIIIFFGLLQLLANIWVIIKNISEYLFLPLKSVERRVTASHRLFRVWTFWPMRVKLKMYLLRIKYVLVKNRYTVHVRYKFPAINTAVGALPNRKMQGRRVSIEYRRDLNTVSFAWHHFPFSTASFSKHVCRFRDHIRH